MLFPETPRVVYDHKVLDQVICQLRFPQILRIGVETPAKFQDVMRKTYPNYAQETDSLDVPREISTMLEEMRMPFPFGKNDPPRHTFSTQDDSRSVATTTSFLALSEKNYRRWEEFRSNIIFAESAFRNEYEPDPYTRIGLRYRNRITRSELNLNGVGWDELLNRELTGLVGDKQFSNSVRMSRVNVELEIAEVEEGRLQLRLGLVSLQNSTEMSYLIDADLYTGRMSNAEDVPEILDHFHATAGHFFRWAILEKLRDALGPRGLADG